MSKYDTLLGDLQPGTVRWEISRNLVRDAAGAACYGKSPGNIVRGCVTVLDGRVLFAKAPRAPRKRKVAP